MLSTPPKAQDKGSFLETWRRREKKRAESQATLNVKKIQELERTGLKSEASHENGDLLEAETFNFPTRDRNLLRFRASPKLEAEFLEMYAQKYHGEMANTLLLFLVLFTALIASSGTFIEISSGVQRALWTFGGVAVCLGIAILVSMRMCATKRRPVFQQLIALLLLTSSGWCIYRIRVSPVSWNILLMLPMFTVHQFILPFRLSLLVMWAVAIGYAVTAVLSFHMGTSQDWLNENMVQSLLLVVAETVHVSVIGYLKERSLRRDFFSDKLITQKVRLSQALLVKMLPRHIIWQLRQGASLITEKHPSVTVLFSHICDFDTHCAAMTPDHLVRFLNRLFSHFDALTDHYGVYKVETIGDVYLVCAGCLPHHPHKHSEVIANLAISMQKSVGQIAVEDIYIKIGMHSGPIIAGVVGCKYPRYRIMGDTVNTASRMSTTDLREGQTQLSEATLRHLESNCGSGKGGKGQAATGAHAEDSGHNFTVLPRGAIEVKGKGKMHTYLLLGHKTGTLLSFPSPLRCSQGSFEDGDLSQGFENGAVDLLAAGLQSDGVCSSPSLAAVNRKQSVWQSSFHDLAHQGRGTSDLAHQGRRKSAEVTIPPTKKPATSPGAGGPHTPKEGGGGGLNRGGGWPPVASPGRRRTQYSIKQIRKKNDKLRIFGVPEAKSLMIPKPPNFCWALRAPRLFWNYLQLRFVNNPGVEKTFMLGRDMRYGQKMLATTSVTWIATIAYILLCLWSTHPQTSDGGEGGWWSHSQWLLSLVCVQLLLLGFFCGVFFCPNRGRGSKNWIVRLSCQVEGMCACAISVQVASYVLASALVGWLGTGPDGKRNTPAVSGLLMIFVEAGSAELGFRIPQTAIICCVAVVSFFAANVAVNEGSYWDYQAVNSQCYLVVIAFVSMKMAFLKEYFHRSRFLKLAKMDNEEMRTQQILSSMLPTAVIAQISSSNRVVAHFRPVASVLFCDIVSFTKLCSGISAEDVVGILNFMFTQFDNIVTKSNVYKVETIGDAYLACAGVVFRQPSFTVDLVKCALHFQAASKLVRSPGNKGITIRVGIFTGPVLAGVIGRKMPRYHLFGETLSLAEAYESQGVPTKVVVCDTTRERASSAFPMVRLPQNLHFNGEDTRRGRWQVVESEEVATVLAAEATYSEPEDGDPLQIPSDEDSASEQEGFGSQRASFSSESVHFEASAANLQQFAIGTAQTDQQHDKEMPAKYQQWHADEQKQEILSADSTESEEESVVKMVRIWR